MDKSVLDTDIFSELLKGIDQHVVTRAKAYRARYGTYTVSVVAVMEIVKGLHKLQREDRIRDFLATLQHVEVLPLDRRSAELAGKIYADLERVGQPVGRADPMVAAIALSYESVLVTGNRSHYERIQARGYPLVLDDWRT